MPRHPDAGAAPARPALKEVSALPQPFQLDAAGEAPVSMEQLLRVLRRYRWSVLGLALLGAAAGVLHALSTVPVYRAETRLLVRFNPPNPASVSQFDSTPAHWLFYQTQADIIRSRAVAERAVDLLAGGAAAAPAPDRQAAPAAVDDDAWAQARALWHDVREQWLPDWREWLPAAPAPRAPRLAPRAREADAVQAGLSVHGGEESEVLVIGFDSTDPERAAEVANAVARAYIDFGLESRTSNVQQATRWLGERIEVLREKLLASERVLREFQAREGMMATQNREQIVSAKLATLTAELVRAQTRRSEADARYRQVQALAGGDGNLEALASLVSSDLVLQAYRASQERERRVAELAERYGEKHPRMVAARAELRDAGQRLDGELRKAVSAVRKELEIAAAQEQHFQRVIDEQQREMRELSGKAFALDELERDVEANRRIYESFLERFRQADVAADYDGTHARVLDPATRPGAPYRPDKQRIVMVAALGGLLLGVVLAFLRMQLDRTFKSKEDVEQALRLPVLGMLPRLRVAPWKPLQVECAVRDQPRSAFAEAVSDIRTAMLFSRVDEPLRTMLITSAVPGEGKTTLAANLALSFGHRGRTLLMEGDLRKGRMASLLGEHGRRGLTDVVSGECSLEDAVTPFPGTEQVFVLCGGTAAPNPLEIISSQRFAQEFERLQGLFDYVVVDGSPLLPVSDSVVLADLCDVTALAVHSERTSQAAAREALKRLQGAHVRPSGVVLQRVDLRRLHAYDGDASGYGRYHVYRGYYGRPG